METETPGKQRLDSDMSPVRKAAGAVCGDSSVSASRRCSVAVWHRSGHSMDRKKLMRSRWTHRKLNSSEDNGQVLPSKVLARISPINWKEGRLELSFKKSRKIWFTCLFLLKNRNLCSIKILPVGRTSISEQILLEEWFSTVSPPWYLDKTLMHSTIPYKISFGAELENARKC